MPGSPVAPSIPSETVGHTSHGSPCPRGTPRCSPRLGGPRGGPQDAPSSPEPKGWAPRWSHAGRGCHAHGTGRRGTALRRATLHPPCLLSAPRRRGVPAGRRQGMGLLWGALRPRIAPAVPPQHPPTPATRHGTGRSQPQTRPSALPNPSPCLGSDPTASPAKEPRPRAKKSIPDPGLWLQAPDTHGCPRRSSGSRSSRAALEPETGEPEPGKGESHGPRHPYATLSPPQGGFSAHPAEPRATQLGLARSAAPRASTDSATADPAPAGDPRHDPLPATPSCPRAGRGGRSGPLSPPTHLFSLRTRGTTRVTLKGREDGVSPAQAPWPAGQPHRAVMPTRSHPVPSWGRCPSAAPRRGGPYRLPWKADPRRPWLPRGSRLASQPLGSHETRVTLEGKGGCQRRWYCWVPPPSRTQISHLPSGP